MRITQVVLTKTKNGNWKITAQSSRQVEKMIICTTDHSLKYGEGVVDQINNLVQGYEWERTPFDD
jgi:hypothetical protein